MNLNSTIFWLYIISVTIVISIDLYKLYKKKQCQNNKNDN